MPELVHKLASFLNHKQLLALEQVSRKLKCIVDAHFSITEHLIFGSLPQVEHRYPYEDDPEIYGKLDVVTAQDKERLDGLLHVVKRCGTRLRTIQIAAIDEFRDDNGPLCKYANYFKHLSGAAELADKCPNIENIFASPRLVTPEECTTRPSKYCVITRIHGRLRQ